MGVITKIVSLFGVHAIAAFGLGLRIEMFVMSLIWSFSSVLTPFVGQNWGAKLLDRINRGIQSGYVLSLIWGAAIFLVFLIFSKQLISIFNINESVIDMGSMFLIITSVCYGFKGIGLLSSAVCSAIKRPFSATSLSLLQMVILKIPFALIGSRLFGLKGIFVGIAFADFISSLISIVRVKSILKISKMQGILT
jgi:Na+-driven multidrug efflux pump